MRFRNIILEQTDETEPEVEVDSEIGIWKQVGNGWLVEFSIGSKKYAVSFTPLDDKEKHWKFIYYVDGKRKSSDSQKFGDIESWLPIWETLIEILKDFVKIIKPSTLKFIGMSSSKRPKLYYALYKLYADNFMNYFAKQKYKSTFDNKRFEDAPSFVISKKKPSPEKKGKLKEQFDSDVVYQVEQTIGDKKISSGIWTQPAQYRKPGDDGVYHSIKVEFLKDGLATQTITQRFKDKNEGLDWAKTVKPTPGPDAAYIKQFGTGRE